jgi:hypothetical protein
MTVKQEDEMNQKRRLTSLTIHWQSLDFPALLLRTSLNHRVFFPSWRSFLHHRLKMQKVILFAHLPSLFTSLVIISNVVPLSLSFKSKGRPRWKEHSFCSCSQSKVVKHEVVTCIMSCRCWWLRVVKTLLLISVQGMLWVLISCFFFWCKGASRRIKDHR